MILNFFKAVCRNAHVIQKIRDLGGRGNALSTQYCMAEKEASSFSYIYKQI